MSTPYEYHTQVTSIFETSEGSFQNRWDGILVFFKNEFNAYVYGSALWAYATFWILGILYTFVDIIGTPEFLKKYKVQPEKCEPVPIEKVLKTAAVVHLNQLLTVPIISIAYYLLLLRGYSNPRQLPSLFEVVSHLVGIMLIEEITFYYLHRLLHNRHLYKWVHKKHHEWQPPIAITALYCHPIEHVLGNLVPLISGPMILGTHLFVIWIWIAIAMLGILNNHAGYHLPFLPSPELHEYHHLKFNQCFGALGILDFIHGTDDRFRNSKCFQYYNTMLLSFRNYVRSSLKSKKTIKPKI